MVNVETRDVYDVLQNLFEEFTKKTTTSCLGESCPQFSQIKVKQNLFITIIVSLIVILVSISTYTYIELNDFKESSYLNKIDIATKRADLSRHVKELSVKIDNNVLILKDYDDKLDSLSLDIERIKTIMYRHYKEG